VEPDPSSRDRAIAGRLAAFIRPTRLLRSAIVLKPATILSLHRSLVKRKYQELFSPKRRGKPGPKGPSPDLIAAIVEMKRRNPNLGYQRIADQIALVVGIELDKHSVRRVLASHYRPEPAPKGPSWLTFLGYSKDSLWSMDLFRCESLTLKTRWVMVVMDHFTRRTIGFAVHRGIPDGPAVCRMFGRIIGRLKTPRFLSSDNDPLFEFHRGKRIFVFWTSTRSRPFPMFRFPIHSLNGSSEPFVASSSITSRSGANAIWTVSWNRFGSTTTTRVATSRLVAGHPTLPLSSHHGLPRVWIVSS